MSRNGNAVYREWSEPLAAELSDVIDEYDRAKRKHGDMTLDSPGVTDLLRLSALMEEVGEVAELLTYDKSRAGLRTELIQVANVALTWSSVVDQ